MTSRPKFVQIEATVNFQTSKRCCGCKKTKDIFEFDVYEENVSSMVKAAMPFIHHSKCKECLK